MARTYKRDARGRFAGSVGGGGGKKKSASGGGGGGKLRDPSTRDKLARTQRSRMTNRNSNDRRIGLPGASPRQAARIKKRISKRNTKIAASRTREKARRTRR